MSTSVRVFALVLIVVYFIVILRLLKKSKFVLKYSLLWLFAGVVMLGLIIWPGIMEWGAELLGIEVASNGLFAICILLEVVIMISLTAVISDFSNRIKMLIQHEALLEKRIRSLEMNMKNEKKDK